MCALWVVGRKGQSNHPADRDSAQDCPLDAKMVEQANQIVGVLRNRVGAGWRIGKSVTALIVAHGGVGISKMGCDRIPNAQVTTERVDKDERCVLVRACHLIMKEVVMNQNKLCHRELRGFRGYHLAKG